MAKSICSPLEPRSPQPPAPASRKSGIEALLSYAYGPQPHNLKAERSAAPVTHTSYEFDEAVARARATFSSSCRASAARASSSQKNVAVVWLNRYGILGCFAFRRRWLRRNRPR